MGASGTDNFCLRWNDFAENVSGAFKELRTESDFFDVTLACTDSGTKTLQAHKVILSACSNFFKSTFRQQTNANKHPNPYIYLRGVTYTDLTSILDFIYNGEVNVAQEDLNSFLAVAEELQIKGLTNRDTPNSGTKTEPETPKKSSSASTPSASKGSDRPRSAAREEQPPVKKVRKSSPAPTPTPSKPIQQKFIEPIEIEPEEVKEVVNIKDDPEVVMASTSAVNVDEAGQDFGGDEYDESYDGYYEDDGAEMGDGAEGTDGTKGYGYGKPTYGGYPTPTPEPEGEVEPVEPPAVFDYNAYTTAYFNKIDEYTHAQNDYKTDSLNVKVNWDLQPAGYQYLKSQYGIYPQVHRPLRPYGAAPSYPRYGGYSYGGYQPPTYGGYQKPQYGGYQKPQYGGYQKPQYGGYKKPHHGGHAEPQAAPAAEPHADHEGHVEGHQWAEE